MAMPLSQDDILFGRIALHYKLVTQDQLVAVTNQLAHSGNGTPLWENLVAQGLLTREQADQLLVVQHEYVAKQVTEAAAAAPPPVPAFSLTDGPRPLERLLEYAVTHGASDIHVHSGAPVKLRLNGQLARLRLESEERIDPEFARTMIHEALTPEQASVLHQHGQVDFAYTPPRHRALPQQRLPATARHRRGLPRHPAGAADPGAARPAREPRQARQLSPGHGAPDRTGRLRQIVHPGGPPQHRQPGAPRSHHQHRGPDRIHPPLETLRGQPAPGRPPHQLLRPRPPRRPARRPRHHRHRRAARSGNHLAGAHRGRNRPPRARLAAHQQRHPHRQPASSASSRPPSRSRSAPWCRSRCAPSSRNAWSPGPTAPAASPPSRCSWATRRSAT